VGDPLKRNVGRLTFEMVTIVRLIVAVLSFSGVVYSQTKPTAREVINAMVTQYKNISSYQDAGDVVVAPAQPRIALMQNISFQQPPRAGETLVSFRTYFHRPNKFRFDWKPKESERESSVWFDGSNVYQWMPSTTVRDKTFTLFRSKYLDITIDEAARSSSGAVFPIISMLVAKASVVSFDDLLDMASTTTLTKEETVEGLVCYVINTELSGAPWTLWIDKQRHLLRKTRTVYSYGSFHERLEKGIRREFVAEETRRDIKINESISKDTFKYRPTLRRGDSDLTR
jgi:outer membrane lipoprotein-sorting protein